VYKEDRTQILKFRKNILFAIIHVTLFFVEGMTRRRNQKLRLKYAIKQQDRRVIIVLNIAQRKKTEKPKN